MKYLYTLITLVLLPISIYSADSVLYIKCPKDAIVVLNGYRQSISGEHRQYTFEFPRRQTAIVEVHVTDKSGEVIYSDNVLVTGGEMTTVNISPKKLKFNLFESEKKVLKKPNFSVILHTMETKSALKNEPPIVSLEECRT